MVELDRVVERVDGVLEFEVVEVQHGVEVNLAAQGEGDDRADVVRVQVDEAVVHAHWGEDASIVESGENFIEVSGFCFVVVTFRFTPLFKFGDDVVDAVFFMSISDVATDTGVHGSLETEEGKAVKLRIF